MSKRDKISFFLLVLMTVAVCLLGFYVNRNFYQDDSYITLRYARNFLDGHGIVWNPGERVEGYSNFLYLTLISLLGKFGVDLVVASRIVGVSSFVALVLFVAWYFKIFSFSQKDTDEKFINFIPVFLVITSFPLIIWSIGGLEGPLLAFFVSIGVFSIVKAVDSGKKGVLLTVSGLAFALGALTRLDSTIFCAVSFCFLFYLWVSKKNVYLKHLLLFLSCFLAIFVPYFIWRYNYYGELLPNTFYVKADHFNAAKLYGGLRYIAYYAAGPPFIFFMLVFLGILNLSRKMWDMKKTYLFAVIVIQVLYVLYVGGDQMKAYRFFVAFIPVPVITIYLLIKPFSDYIYGLRIFLIYFLLFFLAIIQKFYPETVGGVNPAAFYGEAVGKYIRENWPKGSLVAINAAGATPYFAPDNRYIDMLGINDAHIAKRNLMGRDVPPHSDTPGHLKGDGAYVLSREPDYLIIGPAEGTNIGNSRFLSDIEISRDGHFKKGYRCRKIQIDIGCDKRERYISRLHFGGIVFTYYEKNRSN